MDVRAGNERRIAATVGGIEPLRAEGDVDLLQARLEQLFRRVGRVGRRLDLHAAQQLRLHAVRLERGELAEHGRELRRLDRGDGVGQNRSRAVLAQPLQRRGG